MSTQSPSTSAPDQREIARRAYELWEEEGRVHGNHGRHWLEAEKQLRGLADKVPLKEGNAAYPSLPTREAIVDENAHQQKGKDRDRIPAVALKKNPPSGHQRA